jgi:hypothetical protein
MKHLCSNNKKFVVDDAAVVVVGIPIARNRWVGSRIDRLEHVLVQIVVAMSVPACTTNNTKVLNESNSSSHTTLLTSANQR